MKAGGIRRMVIPSKLAYGAFRVGESCEGGLGPRPGVEALGEFQRFKNIYCECILCGCSKMRSVFYLCHCVITGNPDRQYQPDLVLDVKLYGKRS